MQFRSLGSGPTRFCQPGCMTVLVLGNTPGQTEGMPQKGLEAAGAAEWQHHSRQAPPLPRGLYFSTVHKRKTYLNVGFVISKLTFKSLVFFIFLFFRFCDCLMFLIIFPIKKRLILLFFDFSFFANFAHFFICFFHVCDFFPERGPVRFCPTFESFKSFEKCFKSGVVFFFFFDFLCFYFLLLLILLFFSIFDSFDFLMFLIFF